MNTKEYQYQYSVDQFIQEYNINKAKYENNIECYDLDDTWNMLLDSKEFNLMMNKLKRNVNNEWKYQFVDDHDILEKEELLYKINLFISKYNLHITHELKSLNKN